MQYLNNEKLSEIINVADACYPNNGTPQVLKVSDIPREKLLNEDPELIRLRELVTSLNIDEFSELQSLMILGRGASGETVDDWSSLVSSNKSAFNGVQTITYVISNRFLVNYLRSGIEKLTN